MWICQSRSFLSIVEPSAADRQRLGDVLVVRARRPGDIEVSFPGAKVEKRPERDYLFRAFIPREDVALAMADAVRGIDYKNFKDSVRNNRLHDAFAAVWSIMARLQPTPPYSGVRASRQKGLL